MPDMIVRIMAWAVMVTVVFLAVYAGDIAPAGYATQFREAPDAPPSTQFVLGTDELGRDRLARIAHGARISLLLSPAAAALATAISLMLGLIAAHAGNYLESTILGIADLLSSIPTLFLLLTVRAFLPLEIEPATSVAVTFALLGGLGWANGTRVVRAAAAGVLESGYLLQARACGTSPLRIAFRHFAPALRPVISAQFFTSIPLFLIAEANLGILGLSVTEPLPSLGNLLADLHNYTDVFAAPWKISPAIVLVISILSLQAITRSKGRSE